MNRLEFIGQTHQGKLVSIDDVVQFFDHTMAAYEIVGDLENAKIHGDMDIMHSSMKLQVESPNQASLQEVVAYINDTIHNHTTTYGKPFIVDAKITSDNSVDLFVREDYTM